MSTPCSSNNHMPAEPGIRIVPAMIFRLLLRSTDWCRHQSLLLRNRTASINEGLIAFLATGIDQRSPALIPIYIARDDHQRPLGATRPSHLELSVSRRAGDWWNQ